VIDCTGLLQLQNFDLALDALDTKIRQQRERCVKLASEIEKEAALLEKKEALLKKIILRKRQAETELNDLSEKIKISELRLHGVGLNPTSYNAIQKEIDKYKETSSKLETTILEDMEKIEILQKENEKSTKVLAGRKIQLDEINKKVVIEAGKIESEKEIVRTQRSQATLSLQADSLEAYEEIRRKKKGKVIWDAETKGCPACGMGLSGGFVSMLTTSKGAEICPYCGVMIRWVGIKDGIHLK